MAPGHGISYYKNIDKRHAENFANIFDAWTRKDKKLLNTIEEDFPNLYKSFIDIINKI
jgi:hypothetical protein